MMGDVQSIWHEIKEQLAAKKQQVIAEINEYPPPIPACDQQFNFLLEERTRLTRLVREVDAVFTENLSDANSVTRLASFIDSLNDFDEQEKKLWQEHFARFDDEVAVASSSAE